MLNNNLRQRPTSKDDAKQADNAEDITFSKKKRFSNRIRIDAPLILLRQRPITTCTLLSLLLVALALGRFLHHYYYHRRHLWLGVIISPCYQSKAERDARQSRFPTVQERVKLYTSSWYNPPCSSSSSNKVSYKWIGETLHVTELAAPPPAARTTATTPVRESRSRTFAVTSEIDIDQVFYYRHRRDLVACALLRPANLQTYCRDALSTLVPAIMAMEEDLKREEDNGNSNNKKPSPVLLQFGDDSRDRAWAFDCSKNHTTTTTTSLITDRVRLPLIKKFRSALTKRRLEEVTSSGTCNSNSPTMQESFLPIVWKLETERHFNGLSLVRFSDRSWKDKLPMAVFRGALTGGWSSSKTPLSNIDREEEGDNDNTDLENCLSIQRCKLVYMYADCLLVDAKLTSLMGRVPENVNGVRVTEPITKFRGQMTMNGLLKYKGIIILEGNDVASGLKWVLLSQSVVLMPPPTFTSWAMEELLEPWVHYIPLNANLSDVEEKTQWMIDHDDQAQQISHRGSLWIKDLVFHPDAEQDEALIYREILGRYKAHF